MTDRQFLKFWITLVVILVCAAGYRQYKFDNSFEQACKQVYDVGWKDGHEFGYKEGWSTFVIEHEAEMQP